MPRRRATRSFYGAKPAGIIRGLTRARGLWVLIGPKEAPIMAAVDEATALQDKAPQTTPSDFGHVLRNGIVLDRKSDCTIETGVKRLSRMMQRMLRGELVSSKDGLFLKHPPP